MLVCYRDDGFFRLIWYLCSRRLIGASVNDLPSAGFVGRESPSFRGTGARRARLSLIRMHRIRSTPGVRLWRLTCRWEVSPEYQMMPSGRPLERAGSFRAGGGVETSIGPPELQSTDASRITSI